MGELIVLYVLMVVPLGARVSPKMKYGNWITILVHGGGATPKVLILGFSKGPNQTKDIKKLIELNKFNEIPFSGIMRNNLDLALKKIGLLSEKSNVSYKINDNEQNFAFGSLIRCSISKKDKKSGEYKKTGNNILSLALEK